MDLESLATFIAVVEAGSVQGASSALMTSRATIRRRLEELEAAASVPLLERDMRGARPTDAGMTLARHGRRIMEEARSLLGSLSEVGSPAEGELRVAMPPGLPGPAIARLFAVLGRLWPDLRFDARVTEDPCQGLANERHIAICFGAPPPGPWSVLELARIREWLVASRAYLDHKGRITSVAELDRYELLVWACHDEDVNFLPTTDGRWVKVTPCMVSNDVFALRLMAAASAGVAYLPDGELPSHLDMAPDLEPVLPELIGRETTLNLVVPPLLEHLSRVRAFLSTISTFMKKEREPLASRRPTAAAPEAGSTPVVADA